jgi:SAM-dependent methyltransferase
MYMPQPEQALREMRRVLKPGGRMVSAVWGERERCGWSSVFEIVDDEVKSDVCPLFFHLGQGDALVRACWTSGFVPVEQHRITATLCYADAEEAFQAIFAGGPVALAWSRFNDDVRLRVHRRFMESIAPWREGRGYRMPGEFVVVEALVSESAPPPRRMVSTRFETVE